MYKMKKILTAISAIAVLLMVGCTSTYKTTIEKRTSETKYDAEGKITSVIVVDEGILELKEITNTAAAAEALKIPDGKMSERSLALTNLNLGESGFKWFSLELNTTQAPATASDSDKVYLGIAESKKASKTTVEAGDVKINQDSK